MAYLILIGIFIGVLKVLVHWLNILIALIHMLFLLILVSTLDLAQFFPQRLNSLFPLWICKRVYLLLHRLIDLSLLAVHILLFLTFHNINCLT